MFSSLVNADFYGTISVSHDSVKLYQKAFGFSEMANEIPMKSTRDLGRLQLERCL